MPSVVAYWSGRYPACAQRDELCLRMADLGKLSHSFFSPTPSIRRFDQTIAGDILLSRHIFPNPPSSPKLTRIDEEFYSLPRISLFGLEFSLYDGRELYTGDDRISLVFCLDDDPEIDGLLVYVEDLSECRKYEDARIKQADLYLAVPHLHLRYYLEDWLDYLIGGMKYYYIENLYYWRYETLWGEREKLVNRFGQGGTFEFFETLKRQLENEVEAWSGISKEARRFRASVREQMEG